MLRKITTKAMLVALAAFLVGMSAIPAKAQENERIAAVVNDDIISMRDLEERTKLAIVSSRLENTPEIQRRLVPQVLRKLIEEKLQMQEAARQGISASDGDMARTIGNIEKQNNLPPGGLEMATRNDGLDFDSFISQIKAEVSWVKLLRSHFSSAIKISDAEIESQLATIKSNMNKPQYLLSEIFLNADSPAQEGEARALADRIVQQARQGAPFASLARQFSQTASAATGGDIGWIYEGQLPAEVEAVVRNLQKAEVSNPIRTLTGFHILFMRDRRTGGVDKGNAILDLAQLYLPFPRNSRPEDVRVQTELVQTSAEAAESCDDMARLAKELNSPQNPRPGPVPMSALPAQLQAALANLPVGKSTAPLKVANGVAVFMVCSRKDESGLPSREEIINHLEMERLDIQSRRLMRDLRRSAIIDVRI